MRLAALFLSGVATLFAGSGYGQDSRLDGKRIIYNRFEVSQMRRPHDFGLDNSKPCIFDSYTVVDLRPGEDITYADLLCDGSVDALFEIWKGGILKKSTFIPDMSLKPGYKKLLEDSVRYMSNRAFPDEEIPRQSEKAARIQKDFEAVAAKAKKQEMMQ